MSIISLTRATYLLVFRDASMQVRQPMSPAGMGSLMCESSDRRIGRYMFSCLKSVYS